MSIVQLTADILLVLDRPANINEAWGVTVPHIPGCFSTGGTMQEALDNVMEAIVTHTELQPVTFDNMLNLGDYEILTDEIDYSRKMIILINTELYVTKPDIITSKEYPDLSNDDEIDPVMLKITAPIPRVAVGAIIVNPEGEILMCRRPHGPENYVGRLHTFGGKIDLGETMYDAIVREIREECNIDVTKQAWKLDMVGTIEEIEHECSVEVNGVPQMYHWVSAIWVFWMKTNDFINMEPHKHLDMGWRDVETLDKLDIAPSAYHSMVLAGIFDPSESWTTVTDKVPLY